MVTLDEAGISVWYQFDKSGNSSRSLSCLMLKADLSQVTRIDRILYKQFQQLCLLEKLRPGEAVESLIRAAVEAKSITGIHPDDPRTGEYSPHVRLRPLQIPTCKAQEIPRARGELFERDRRTT